MPTFKEPEKIEPSQKEKLKTGLDAWVNYKFGVSSKPDTRDCLISYQDRKGDFFVEQLPSRVPWSAVTQYRLHPFNEDQPVGGPKDNGMEHTLRKVCNDMAEFLIEKNRAYGNSAAEPIGVFAKRLGTLAQIDVRIDDKLNRLAKGSEYPGDDTVKDLTGYLLLRMAVQSMEVKDDTK